MKNKINQIDSLMHKDKILRSLFEKSIIEPYEKVAVASGFEHAILGVTDTEPKMIAYDYWVSLDVLLRNTDMDFDDAQDWLDAFSLSNYANNDDLKVIFIKTINPKYGYLERKI